NHLENNILLGLALYRALQADGQSSTDAYTETRDYLAATAQQQANRIRAFKRFLPKRFRYPVVRWFVRQQMHTLFPADGWDWTWLEDSPRRMAFDGTRCLYLDTLRAYGAAELIPAFCNTDDVMGKGMEPEVVFERQYTLGRGDDHCDFCFRNTRFSGNLPR
ncbi:MAG TPA: L-2-amino-thiazoline-4-carboxylic acid hydrolase, partial [Phototrophicaceae bacterium]|nr:L-2-amino-thiazoline-4-carboxylic acid hydrolase [Phototrophicaceae bacterium]